MTPEEAAKSRKRKPGPVPSNSKRGRAAKRSAETLPEVALDHEHYRVYHADVRDLAMEEPVDLILTDPPYAKSALPEWDALGAFAARTLRPGGFLVAYSGQAFLPEVLSIMNRHVPFCWTIAVLHTSDQKNMVLGRWMSNQHKLVLVFRKSPMSPRRLVPDVIAGDGRDKDLHEWQQGLGEAVELLRMFSEPGDTVVDPMVGSGTTGAACVATGRRFIGGDRDADAVKVARMRVSAALGRDEKSNPLA